MGSSAEQAAKALAAHKPPGMSHEEFVAAIERAQQEADAMPPMTPEQKRKLEEARRNHLRVIWREVDGQKRRVTTFIPIDRETLGPDFLAALDAAGMTVEVRGFKREGASDAR